MRAFLIISASVIFMLGSCIKEKEFPIEPQIEFNNFTKVLNPPDTIPTQLILSFRFTDGDGDIGLYEHETDPPFDYNLFIDMYKLENNLPSLIIFPDTTTTFNSRIPRIDENKGEKPIEGMIEYTFDYSLLRSFLLSDTIAFDISIKDRALHQSNTIRTPFFIVE
ncbi:MAG: hypothetical protein IH597_13075 [Bacteroidales bacterium]|nr:hypothetical protein [Bacteroidales bacterium]